MFQLNLNGNWVRAPISFIGFPRSNHRKPNRTICETRELAHPVSDSLNKGLLIGWMGAAVILWMNWYTPPHATLVHYYSALCKVGVGGGESGGWRGCGRIHLSVFVSQLFFFHFFPVLFEKDLFAFHSTCLWETAALPTPISTCVALLHCMEAVEDGAKGSRSNFAHLFYCSCTIHSLQKF